MKSVIHTIGILFLIMSCQPEEKSRVHLWEYLPEDTAILIKINDFDSFVEGLEKNSFLASFKTSEAYGSIAKKLTDLRWLAPKGESLLAFSRTDIDTWEYTFVTEYDPGLLVLDSVGNKKQESLTVQGKEIDRFEIDERVFFTFKSGQKLVMTPSRTILENLLNTAGSVKLPEALKKLINTGNALKTASLFMDLDGSGTVLQSLALGDLDKSLSNFSDWVVLDINLQSDRLSLGGISIAKDSTENFLNLFENTTPLPNLTASFAPVNTQAILSLTFDDFRKFSKNKRDFLQRATDQDSLFATVEEIGCIYLSNKRLWVLNTFGAENLMEYLKDHTVGTYDFLGNEILEINRTNFLEKSLSPVVREFNARHVTVLENAFLFSEDRETLQEVLRGFRNGQTWNKEPAYKDITEHMASESSLLYVSNARGMTTLADMHLTGPFKTHFVKSNDRSMMYAAQVIADRDFYHTNITVDNVMVEDSKNEVLRSFAITLDNEVAMEAQFVTNHNTRTKEIVVQDADNTLYLISNNGKVLWKKPLEGRIQGKVHQVDVFKNGKLQLAFTTNNQFLILDRNGKEVQPFVKTFPEGNLNPLAVFDYDGKKDYRFVVTQNEKVWMYNNKGNVVKGFKYIQAEAPIIAAPKHFRIGRKDYLVFQLADGSLKILNRVGNVRVPMGQKIRFSENEIHVYKKKFIVSDKEGILYQIDEKGKVAQADLNLNEDHGLTATSKTLALMDHNELSIKGNKVALDLGVYIKPRIFYLYDKIYVNVTDIQNQRTYLFDSNARPIANFPVFGISNIDLEDVDNDRKLEFVVRTGENSIAMYQIN